MTTDDTDRYIGLGERIHQDSLLQPGLAVPDVIECQPDARRQIIVTHGMSDWATVLSDARRAEQQGRHAYLAEFSTWEGFGSDWHGAYLGYDGMPSRDPVNQAVNLPIWRAHAARFAHDLDMAQSAYSFLDRSQTAQSVIVQWSKAVCGHAWQMLDLWALIDPRDGVTWKAAQALPENAVTALCAECEIATWARQTIRRIDVSRFRTELDAGRIRPTDRSSNVWVPGDSIITQHDQTSITAASLAAFYSSLASNYEWALDWYDDHVAHDVRPHAHDSA